MYLLRYLRFFLRPLDWRGDWNDLPSLSADQLHQMLFNKQPPSGYFHSRDFEEYPKMGVRAYARTPIFGPLLVISWLAHIPLSHGQNVIANFLWL